MVNTTIENPPLSILSIMNDLNRLNIIIEEKNRIIEKLHLELKNRDEQIQKLIDKNVELSLKIIRI